MLKCCALLVICLQNVSTLWKKNIMKHVSKRDRKQTWHFFKCVHISIFKHLYKRLATGTVHNFTAFLIKNNKGMYYVCIHIPLVFYPYSFCCCKNPGKTCFSFIYHNGLSRGTCPIYSTPDKIAWEQMVISYPLKRKFLTWKWKQCR